MTFADRLKEFPPMAIAAEKPSESRGLNLCLPRLLVVDGNAVGLANLEIATLLVAGAGSTRLLYALGALLGEAAGAPDEHLGSFGSELREATTLIQRHLASLAAASDLAHEEHEATHQHGKDPLH